MRKVLIEINESGSAVGVMSPDGQMSIITDVDNIEIVDHRVEDRPLGRGDPQRQMLDELREIRKLLAGDDDEGGLLDQAMVSSLGSAGDVGC